MEKKEIFVLFILMINFSFISAFDYGQGQQVEVSFFTGNLTNLSQLADTNVPTPSNNEVLTWSSATSKWIAQSVSMVTRWIIDTSNGFFYTTGDV